MNYLTHLECSNCLQSQDAGQLVRVCLVCGYPLLARYDLARAAVEIDRNDIVSRRGGLWRFRELLPVEHQENVVSLGEGGQPVLTINQLGRQLGINNLYLKDEGLNPTGSFKALGLSVALSRALELGAREFVIPTAGNAGSALSAYAARAGVPAHVYMPKDAPIVNTLEVKIVGADLHLVDGLINDAGRLAATSAAENGWFDVSTLKEPYRLEGKKIMGYEVAMAFDWHLPDVIIYPTGGGTGLIGMWKAFDEMEKLGWIDDHRPRMVVVQAEGCAPIVKAHHAGMDEAEPWPDAHTIAGGLRVPVAIGSKLMLAALRKSHGTAVAVTDDQIREAQALLASSEGIYACLEGAATIAALLVLKEQGWLVSDDKILVFNTGTGLKERPNLS